MLWSILISLILLIIGIRIFWFLVDVMFDIIGWIALFGIAIFVIAVVF